jgi:hypothetical protein
MRVAARDRIGDTGVTGKAGQLAIGFVAKRSSAVGLAHAS